MGPCQCHVRINLPSIPCHSKLSAFSKTLVSFNMRQKARAIEKPGRKEVRRRQIVVVRTRKILPDQFSICLSYLSAVPISFGSRKIFIRYMYRLNLVFVDDILQNKTLLYLNDDNKKWVIEVFFFAKLRLLFHNDHEKEPFVTPYFVFWHTKIHDGSISLGDINSKIT